MTLEPLWIKEVKLETRGLDPLGLSRVSSYLVEELIPGITVLTNRGRNYIFYSWAIHRAITPKFESSRKFYKTIIRLEAANVVGGLLDAEENFPDSKGPIGRNRGLDEIASAKNQGQDYINVDFSVLAHQGGGFGQYYYSSMEKLGLLYAAENKLHLSSIGENCANAYETNIAETTYFKKYLDENVVPLGILKEYGRKGSFLRLNEFENERDILCSILFSENQNRSENQISRKSTLIYILALFSKFSDSNYYFTDEDLRNFFFYGNTIKEDVLVDYLPKNTQIRETINQWRFFQFHEHFTFALEHILISFLNSLEDNILGLSKIKFLENNKNFIEVIEKFLNHNLKEQNLEKFIALLLSSKDLGSTLDKKTSELFDKRVIITDNISEHSIRMKITNSMKNRNYEEVVGYSILLLIILIIRYWQYLDTMNLENTWIRKRELENWSIYSFIRSIEGKMRSLSLKDLFYKIFTEIIEQHDIIAHDKIFAGNDTFRFQQKGDNFFFKMSYEWGNRNDRFDSITSIFEDLGIIQKEDGIFKISLFGRQILERYSS